MGQMAGKTSRITKNQRRIDAIFIVLVFFLSIPAIKNLLVPGFFQTFDGDFHLTHVYWLDQAIKQGHFPVRWIEEINRGRGYPFFNFYYPLLYYLAEIPHLAGAGLTNSLKLVLGLSFPISGMFMYLWIKQLWGRWAGLTAATLWMYVPYRFVSIYVAARFGENIAFVWIPLVLWAVTKKYWGLAGIAWALLILSHNIQALLFSPLLFAWSIVLGKKLMVAVPVLALLASAYFWLPVLIEKQWTWQGQQPAYDFHSNFPPVKAYFYQPWGYGLNTTGQTGGVSLQLGVAQWLALAALIWGVKKRSFWPMWLWGWAGLTFVFMNKVSLPLWERIPLLPEVQIPSRLLGVLAFSAATAAGWLAGQKKLLGLGLIMLVLYTNRNYLRPGYFDRYDDNYYLNNAELMYGTTDPYGENTPIWSRMSVDTFADKILVDPRSPNAAMISESVVQPRRYRFISEATGSAWIKIRTVYYPGWRITIDGNPSKFGGEQAYLADDLGQLLAVVPAGKHKVEMWWEETAIRKLANGISLGAWLVLGGLLLRQAYKRRG